MILADFCCPVHGTFEAMIDSGDDAAPCPHLRGFEPTLTESQNLIAEKVLGLDRCGISSPWLPAPVFGVVQVGCVGGKWEPPPTPQHSNVMQTLGEGQRYTEWRSDRKKMWREHDRKVRKERG